VIDFRYHLVSLIAVFLAVALGIVIGTTQLNGPVLSNLQSQVNALQKDKRSLEDRTQGLQAQVSASDAFEQAVAPALVKGSLTSRRVLIVVADDQVSQDTVDQMSTLIGQAGGTVGGTVKLAGAYSDPASDTALQNYVSGPGLPAGLRLDESGDTGKTVGSLLGQVLMIPKSGAAVSAATVSTVMAGLSALKVLSLDSSSVTPSDYAVVLTAKAFSGSDADTRNAMLTSLVTGLDAVGSGTVVAGYASSAATGGLVNVVRGAPTLSAAISTVDDVDSAAGQISTVLALGPETKGTSGKYGTGQDTQPVPPVPTANR
jgi:hypothetical protein